jgi:hypothetical protein
MDNGGESMMNEELLIRSSKDRAEAMKERLAHLYGEEFERIDLDTLEKAFPNFAEWVKKYLRPFKNIDGFDKKYLIYKINCKNGQVAYIFELFTSANRYRISLHGNNYMGCTAKNRKIRVGDNWTRGCDLPAGEISEETFLKILVAIVNYETLSIGAY